MVGGAATIDAATEEGVDTLDFAAKRHQLVYDALLDLREEGRACDVLTLVDHLRHKGHLDEVGGPAAVSNLEAILAPVSMVREYAQRLLHQANLRRCVEAAQRVIAAAAEPGADPASIQSQAQSDFAEVYLAGNDDDLDPSDTLEEIWGDLQEPKRIRGVETGFRDLDRLTGGPKPGDLWVLAARPGMGKTAITLNIAKSAAERGHPVGFVSVEMPRKQLYTRMMASTALVDIPPGGRFFKSEEWSELAGAKAYLHELPLRVKYAPGCTMGQLTQRIARFARDGAELIFVDYLQILSAAGSRYEGNKTQEVGEMTRQLKAAAGANKVAIVLLSQLNRGVESRSDKRPMMSDLRESGAIEQDADLVAFLYREEYYLKEKTPEQLMGMAELDIAKHRAGSVGKIWLKWQGKHQLFADVD